MNKLEAIIVGYVRKNEEDAYIDIKPEYWDATTELEKFSHIIVLWWITGRDTPEDRNNLKGTPPVEGAKTSGVFATRSPRRPTPIGHSIVAIVDIDSTNHRITIDHMDAFDGTPVIDIKPYMPTSDKVDGAKVPSWFLDNISRYSEKPFA